MSKLHDLAHLGQAVWYDYIRRAFLRSGQLQTLIDRGVSGVTSNPSILEKAIAGSADYDDALQTLVAQGLDVDSIYETLVLADIQEAADLLHPVFEDSEGVDGYVSLEVSPTLAYDTQGTIDQAKRLFAALDRPNILIKVPATPSGIPAIEALIGAGINVNVTLIFSLSHYRAVAEAYLAGLESWAQRGGDLSRVASVASFFISRVDTAVDAQLDELNVTNATSLKGQIAIASSKVAYAAFQQLLSSPRWQKLAQQGARAQRLLWASTSTKNPQYPDTLYVDALIGPDTINTVPPATLTAFLDHGTVANTLAEGLGEAQAQLEQLAALGVELEAITQTLQEAGVASFAHAFETLKASISEKRGRLLDEETPPLPSLHGYQADVDATLSKLKADEVMQRIWDHDHTVWQPDPTEVCNRLGWLHSPEQMLAQRDQIEKMVAAVRTGGYTQALLLGMGGSSLAPEVFGKIFGVRSGYLELSVLDSTDPQAILAHAQQLDLDHTLFIVATKSGGTVETLSLFKYFYNLVLERVGEAAVGAHFVAITDPGSPLVELAQRYHFRTTFLNDPNIGGRYAALSYFGLVPAALVGVALDTLLERALTMACNCEGCNCAQEGDNAGARLGAVLGTLAKTGRDKLTLVTSPSLSALGPWIEQLVAESTGKRGTGILPVTGEALEAPEAYGDDRLFVHLRLEGDDTHGVALEALRQAGHPLVQFNLRDRYDVGGEFFRWEVATAVAGHVLNINPFDQPNVESAKIMARKLVAEYAQTGTLPGVEAEALEATALDQFLAQARPGDYVALQAYVQPTDETDAALQALRTRLQRRLKLATTVGYGPRFLHSTGQLHKGDAGHGLFVQLTSTATRDVTIPNEAGSSASSISFGTLKAAQALGDRRALVEAGRRVVHFQLGTTVAAGLEQLLEAIA